LKIKDFSTALILRPGVQSGLVTKVRRVTPNPQEERTFYPMWKPTNQPQTPGRPAEPERPTMPTPSAPMAASEPAAAPRPMTATTTADQATIGKSLVIKGEVTGSESLYIDGRVEGSINLAGNRVTIGRNGIVAANINAREIVVLGKVRGNLTASDRVDIRSDGSLTGDVVAARISIEDGAFFKGGIDIRKGGQNAQPGQQKANGEDKSIATPEPAAIGARA
jgi:cytoskeletal protein CcmA (bactofilin family)